MYFFPKHFCHAIASSNILAENLLKITWFHFEFSSSLLWIISPRMERILLIWQYPSQVSLGLWSSLIGTMLTWWISQKQIFYDCVLPFKTTKYGGQREKCNVKLDHNARITAGQSGPGKEAELGNFYSGTQKRSNRIKDIGFHDFWMERLYAEKTFI